MYSVKDKGCMKRHKQSQHMLGPLQALTHRKCMVQSLFQGIRKAYFKVVASEKKAGRLDLLEALSRVGASPDGSVDEDAVKRSLQVLEDVLQQRDGREALACCHNFLWTVVSAKDRGGWIDVMQ